MRFDCVMWDGAVDKDGYGLLSTDGKAHRANRFFLEKKLGRPLGAGMWALHTCDEPGCVNPEHLWEGTRDDNREDMLEKGREARGESHGLAKLTDSQIAEIRHLYASGVTQDVIGAKFNVTGNNVGFVVRGATWRHVGGLTKKQRRLTDDEAVWVKKLYKVGLMTQVEIAAAFSVSNVAVSRIVRGLAKAHIDY